MIILAYRFIKRFGDVVLAAAGLVVLSPVFFVLALAVKIGGKGPVLFRQKRIGRKKKPFTMLKFRTMRMDSPKDTPTHLLENSGEYITRTGEFLRKTSLDELPQLLNILVGHMSIIGPRPALWNQDDLIKERDKYGANDIRPGLTGWAQVNGRDELSISAKAEFDGEYVRRMGFLLDCKCFAMTVVKVIRGEGVK